MKLKTFPFLIAALKSSAYILSMHLLRTHANKWLKEELVSTTTAALQLSKWLLEAISLHSMHILSLHLSWEIYYPTFTRNALTFEQRLWINSWHLFTQIITILPSIASGLAIIKANLARTNLTHNLEKVKELINSQNVPQESKSILSVCVKVNSYGMDEI